ncbi:acetylornithine transaminase [Corynebacterium anserum]|uniref:Acetylornithine aminotransferase n=1 Tax=Corynebacterium anserum TaxID=2684406 RepID=A0A7G7YQZ0_9CORY|nr:acetylornithine transaminase [Corynebacterium anserum]MBC2680823.1 acetylornithine transaminase [Corynebacterium anserum]QNH96910.1 acetylornithine transaminase [Corynebacterium anserum]
MPASANKTELTASPDNWQTHWNSALMGNYGTPQIELVKGSGAVVEDSEGNHYLDLLSGIAVNALGHAHPAIIEAVTKQISTLGHTSNIFAHPQVITLAENIRDLLGDEAKDAQVFFCNSGAEANEAAFKIARATGRPRIISAEKGFHGRTMGSLALTGQPDKRRPFEPMPAGVEYVPYGDIDALRAVCDENVAAVFMESIQGETGVIPAPRGFFSDLRALCDDLGILMVVDEVQAGMGRTGEWFGFHVDDVLPDVVTLAKGLGGGLPIGATVAMPKAQLLAKGMHGTTFGGNPVVCAAANAVIDTIKKESLLDNVRRVGGYIAEELAAHPRVKEVRGRGLMLGVVLDKPLEVDPLDYGLIINKPSPDVLRLVPPLNLSLEQAQTGVEKMKNMLDA